MRKSFLLAAMILALPGLAWAEAVVVFAASSLKAALDPAAALYRQETGAELVLSYAASPAIARQVEQGAPADLVILAAVDWMDVLDEQALIDPATRRDLWGNGLSLIAHDPGAAPIALDGSADLAAYLGEARLAMALVDAVPVGQYGKAALLHLGQWQAVEPKVVQAQDARAAVALVASGQAEFGLVYASDARALADLGLGVEVGRFPDESHAPIVYPAAIVAGAAGAEAAAGFLDFLLTQPATDIFAGQGYRVLAR